MMYSLLHDILANVVELRLPVSMRIYLVVNISKIVRYRLS